MFIDTGIAVFNAVMQLSLICLSAGILVKRNLVSPEQVKALSKTCIEIFVPCIIVAKTVSRFDPGELPHWWVLPLAGFLLVMSGLLFSGLVFRFKSEKRPFMVMASMQNAIYIVLPIGQLLYPDQFDVFALYSFLLVLGLNPMMWSLGKVLLSSRAGTRIVFRDFLSPPLVAIVLSVVAVFTGISDFIPHTVIESIDLLGQATVPVAVFVLGASMGAISVSDFPKFSDILIVAAVKFVLIPGVTFAVLALTGAGHLMPLVSCMLIIQAASPPATNLALIVKNYGGDEGPFSAMMLIQYVLCVLFLPLWIAVWQWWSRAML